MLQLDEVEAPVPGPGEVLVRVVAAGVNRADLLQRAGRYPAPAGVRQDVPGLEFAGLVEEAAGDVQGWRAGERVMGLSAGASYAEYVVQRSGHLLPVPDGWSWEMAAATPEAYCTALDALDQVRACEGERALVHAVGSSVGVALLHVLHARGVEVIGTSRTVWKLERARALGLDTGVQIEGTFQTTDALRDSVDVVCDLVGGTYVTGDLECARSRGRIVVIGLTAGRSATLDLGLLLRKRLTLIGTVLRSRSDTEKAAIVTAVRAVLLPLFASGAVIPVVDRVFPMQDAAEAHRFVESNGNFGSVVLRWE